MKSKTNSLVFAGCLAVAASIPARAASLPAAADAYVQDTLPAQNFGALPQLQVDKGRSSLLKFDLQSVMPAKYTGGTIQQAQLVLYLNRVITPGFMAMRRACSGWSEASLTFANRPLSCFEGANSFSVDTDGTFVSVDVTKIVQFWADGVFANDGFVLEDVPGLNGAAYFDSKENTATGHVARLEITFTGAPGPAGIAGPQGSQGPTGPAGLAQLPVVTCSGGLVSRVNANGTSSCSCPPVNFDTLTKAIDVSGAMNWTGSDTVLGSGSCTMTITQPIGRIDAEHTSWTVKSTGSYSRCAIIGRAPDCISYISSLGSGDFPICSSAVTSGYPALSKPSAVAFVFCN